MLVRSVDSWWTHHTAAQPYHGYDNVTVADWRPDYRRLPPYLAMLCALLTYAPEIVASQSLVPALAARYVLWWLCVSAGFVFVSHVTSCRDGVWFRGRHGGLRDFLIVHAAAALLYVEGISTSGALWNVGIGRPSHRFVQFTLPFLAGLNLSYAEKLPRALNRSINGKNWRTGSTTTRLWMCLRVGVVAYLGYRLLPFPPARSLLALEIGLAAALWVITAYLRRHGYYFYLHHWFIFLVLAFVSQTSLPALALFTAAFIEGAARWSCAPLWHR